MVFDILFTIFMCVLFSLLDLFAISRAVLHICGVAW